MRRRDVPRATQGRPSSGGGVVLWVCTSLPVIGALVQRAPLVAGCLAAVVAVGAAALASPVGFLGTSAALTTAIPKAGFLVSGLPLPLMMFVLLGAAVMLRGRGNRSSRSRAGGRLAAAALAWLAYRLLALHFDGGSTADLLALAGWFGLPLVLLLAGPPVGALRGPVGRLWARRLELGVMIASAFAVVQQALGIERAAIPGVTRSVGADYSLKPLAFAGGSKIPSTYQNGNVLGVITAFFFLISAERVLRGRGSRRDIAIMVLTATASVLSGSRTILIGAVLGIGVLIVRSGLRRQTIVVCALSAVALFAVLHFSPALSARLTGTTASDPALALRTRIWSKVVETTPVAELVTGGPAWAHPTEDPGLAEGILGAIQQVGIAGMVLFAGAMLAATKAPELRRWRLLLIPVVVSLAVDSAYLVFPTLFIPLARMYAPLEVTDAPPGDPENGLPGDAGEESALEAV